MAQQIYITYTDQLEEAADSIGKDIFISIKIKTDNAALSADDLKKMALMCPTEFFYVINSDTIIKFTNFNFSFKPSAWDKQYVHIWDAQARIRLYNKELVIANPELYSDDCLIAGKLALKVHTDKIFELPCNDIIFLSYDEEYADINYAKLTEKFPRAKRVHGVKGILEAHISAANTATSEMFFVVDADAEIEPTFEFDYTPTAYNKDTVHVWHSRNPINDLIYGYGGVKLFPTKLLLNYTGSPIDFTTSVSNSFKVIPEISNITKFNTDPFSDWRSGFRECTKLASKLIANHDNIETEERLTAWCTIGKDREFGEFAIMGANEGMEFGRENINQPSMLGLINDYKWLANRFNS